MIGKNFRAVFGKQKGQRGQRLKREEGLPDNYDNFRQLFSTLKSMKTASRTRNAWRADGERQLDNSGGKRMGKRVEAGGAGVPPAKITGRENPPKTTCLPQSPIQRRGRMPHLLEVTRCVSRRSCATSGSAASCRAQPRGECAAERPHRILSLFTCHCARRAPRHLAAPLRMEGGRKREKKIYKNVSNAAARPRMAGRREGCLH